MENVKPAQEPYWFYRWLDDNDIGDLERFAVCLDQPAVLEDLACAARGVMTSPGSIALTPESLVAASDLDLSGRDSCIQLECRMRQVSDIFSRAWLYFDKIVVDDTIAALAARTASSPEWRRDLLDSAAIALHVLSLGVDELLYFDARERRQYCRECAQEVVHPAGITDLETTESELALQFQNEADFELENVAERHFLLVRHPLISEGGGWLYELPEKLRLTKKLRLATARSLARTLIGITIGDVATARDFCLPLGTASARDRKLLELSSALERQAAIAFTLELPVLHKIPVSVLLEIRRDEGELFDRFRTSLRTAIRERVRAAPDATTDAIAEEIRQDLIEPELARIRACLRAADRALRKRGGLQIGVGALLTTCGLLTGLLPIAVLGAGTIASGVVLPAQERIRVSENVEMSDLFFLWRASQHAG